MPVTVIARVREGDGGSGREIIWGGWPKSGGGGTMVQQR